MPACCPRPCSVSATSTSSPRGDAGPIRAGDVIGQDRTTVAIELERVFEDLLPLLAVRPRGSRPPSTPSPRRSTAAAPAQARTSSSRTPTPAELNPRMPTIQADISGLADLATRMRWRRPGTVRAAKALITTNTTIVQKQDSLKGFAGTASFANTTADFLDGTGDRIIERAGSAGRAWRCSPSTPRSTPAWPRPDELGEEHRRCLEERHVPHHPRDHAAAAGLPAGRGACLGRRSAAPDCYGLPDEHGSQANPRPGITFDDGTNPRAAARRRPCRRPSRPAAASRSPTPARGWPAPAEQQVVAALLARDGSRRPSAITTLLAGPMLRGSVVNQR